MIAPEQFDWEALLHSSSVQIHLSYSGSKKEFRGTGFIVAPGIIATAAHVVDWTKGLPASEIYVRPRASKTFVSVDPQSIKLTPDGAAVLTVISGITDRLEEPFVGVPGGLVALTNSIYTSGDPLVAFGFPELIFTHGGQASTLEVIGDSFEGPDALRRLRVKGASLKNGTSGSPVVNLRTGGVCGFVHSSNLHGEGHLVSIASLTELVSSLSSVTSTVWSDSLSDDQLRAGRWAFPTLELRKYMTAMEGKAEKHPYSGALDRALPALSKIHHQQSQVRWMTTGADDVASRTAFSNEPRTTLHAGTRNSNVALAHGGLLIGEPGGGKSSALQMLIVSMCRDFATGLNKRIPATISATDISMSSPLPASLSRIANRELFFGDNEVSPDLFSNPPLHGGKWHLVVDGLDEVLDANARKKLLAKLVREVDKHQAMILTITSRQLPLPEMQTIEEALPGGIWELQPFDEGQSILVMKEWFTELDRPDLAQNIGTEAARIRDRVAPNLLNNPLMLSMICQLVCWDDLLEIPHSRYQIYKQYVEALRDRFFSENAGNALLQISTLTGRYGERARESAARSAENIYQELGEVSLDWLISDAPQKFKTLSERYERPNNVRPADWDNALEALVRRTGIAAKSGEGLRFLHQTIAEYLAAWTLEQVTTANDRALIGLVDRQSHLSMRHSFIRFAVPLWLNDQRFGSWITSAIRSGEGSIVRLVDEVIQDGVALPPAILDAVSDKIVADLHKHSRGTNEVELIRLLNDVASSSRVDEELRFLIGSSLVSPSTRLWSLVVLAGRSKGEDARIPSAEDPDLDEIELAVAALVATNDHKHVDLVTSLASDDAIGTDARAVITFAMASNTGAAPTRPSRDNLRALIPRLFSQPQSVGAIDRIVSTIRVHHPAANVQLVEQAYAATSLALEGRHWRSGQPHLSHSAAVAQILADLGMGAKTVAMSLLHDAVSEGDFTLGQLESDFGQELVMLVTGALEVDKLEFHEEIPAETARKMVVAMNRDIRVLVVKIADRLQNARTWGFLDTDTATRMAKETLEIYAPLAHRMRMQTIRWELEDLSFSILYPKLYVEIDRLVHKMTPNREEYVKRAIDSVVGDLKRSGIKGSVTGRPKQYYAIYQDLVVRGREFDEIYDLVAVRVLVRSVRECYAALGAIHDRWTPIPGRFKDFIATPRFDLYQSLHSTVIGPDGRPVEVIIRTQEMHQRAENGAVDQREPVARAWASRKSQPLVDVDDMAWSALTASWESDPTAADEFRDSMQTEMGAKELYVFTPKGRVIGLPAGATPLDFAYAVHTDIGHRTMGAKVNGRLTMLESELVSGDTVEIFSSKNRESGPSLEWLDHIKSKKAKRAIRKWFAQTSH